MSSGVQFTIHPTDEDDPRYAIMPDDKIKGFLVGDMEEVVNLRSTLSTFIIKGEMGEPISPHDKRLGWAWLTVQEAAEEFGISERTLQDACLRGSIPGAERRGRQWMFPRVTFRGWVINRPKRGPKSRSES